ETGNMTTAPPGPPTMFGIELRRRRLEAGLSLTEFSNRIHYSKGYLSRIETGAKPAGSDFARRCDAALDAGGELARLAPEPVGPRGRTPFPDEDGQVWVMQLSDDGASRFVPMSRRAALELAGSSLFGFAVGTRTRHAVPADPVVAVAAEHSPQDA